MKKIFMMMLVLVMGVAAASAQTEGKKVAEIKFDSLSYNFKTFNENDGPQTCVFAFTNVGNAPLVINQAVATCGCTVPQYTKTPVMPGERGELKVTYNGTGRYPGYFKKTITVRTNGKVEMTRLYIEGDMIVDEK